MFNPALPISFRCENLGDNVVFECGCVDVSTEGRKNYDGTYGSLTMDTDSGSVDIPGPSEFNTAILAMHSKNTLNGLINTRDVLKPWPDSLCRSALRCWCMDNKRLHCC